MEVTKEHEIGEEESFGLMYRCPNCDDTFHILRVEGIDDPKYCSICGMSLEFNYPYE